MQRSASVLKSYCLAVTQYLGTIPGFPYSPRCLFSSTVFWLFWPTVLHIYTQTYTQKDVTSAEPHTGGGTDDWWQVAESTTDDVQLYRSTFFCDVWDIRWAYRLQQVHELCGPEVEGRLKATTNWIQQNLWRNLWENRGGRASCLHKHWRKTKLLRWITVVLLPCLWKIVPALIFTYWAAFLVAPTIGSTIFLLCFVPFTFVLQKIRWDSNGFVAITSHFQRRDPGLWELFGIWSHKPNFMDVVCSPRGPPGCVNAKS